MHTLATLHALRQHIGMGAAETGEDARLYALLRIATRQIERHTARTFRPYHATIAHDVNMRARRELVLADDLLELHALVNAGASINLDDVLQEGAGVLRLLNGRYFTVTDTVFRAIGVQGIWGYHDEWHEAWRATGDNLAVEIGANDTQLAVGQVGGGDGDGNTPRFQVGQLLRVDEEYLAVIGIDIEANTLTVSRAGRGTTAQAHTLATAIWRYQPPLDAESACLRWAYRLYREVDAPAELAPKPLHDWVMSMRRIKC